MSVLLWWRERLDARFPLNEKFKIEPFNFKQREGAIPDQWPGRVARRALYESYCDWVDLQNVKTWPGTEPEDTRRAKPVNELTFFTTLSPCLYVNGRKRMLKNYKVKKSVPFEGGYQTTKVRRYFIRLGEWQEHVDAFRRLVPREAVRVLDASAKAC